MTLWIIWLECNDNVFNFEYYWTYEKIYQQKYDFFHYDVITFHHGYFDKTHTTLGFSSNMKRIRKTIITHTCKCIIIALIIFQAHRKYEEGEYCDA